MLIGEFSKKVGVSADTLRFYEKKGFFSKGRTSNGYRDYTEKDVEQAKMIAKGKSMGFTLSEILTFTREMEKGSKRSSFLPNLRSRIEKIDEQIASLKAIRKVILEKIEFCDKNEGCGTQKKK